MPTGKTKTADQASGDARMSFGDHLEELRRRVIWALVGLLASTILCFNLGDVIIGLLTAPYAVAMENLGFDPRMVQLNPIESFMEYFKIALKFGVVLAAPWILYQLWQFIATGLYSSEKRLIRLFAPTSIILFVIGATFMITIVLTGLMSFLINISGWFPLPDEDNPLYRFLKEAPAPITATQPTTTSMQIPIVERDPNDGAEGGIWFNRFTQRLVVRHGDENYSVRLQESRATQLVQPFFSIAEYLGFVVNLALAFGLGFQIPIVVVFLIAVRLISAAQMSSARKYVILGVAILAAILTPSPDVGTMLLLAGPMILLFEVGLLVGRIVERRRQEENAT